MAEDKLSLFQFYHVVSACVDYVVTQEPSEIFELGFSSSELAQAIVLLPVVFEKHFLKKDESPALRDQLNQLAAAVEMATAGLGQEDDMSSNRGELVSALRRQAACARSLLEVDKPKPVVKSMK